MVFPPGARVTAPREGNNRVPRRVPVGLGAGGQGRMQPRQPELRRQPSREVGSWQHRTLPA
jgi:hypothetical protein